MNRRHHNYVYVYIHTIHLGVKVVLEIHVAAAWIALYCYQSCAYRVIRLAS